jgi:hypothetical protein
MDDEGHNLHVPMWMGTSWGFKCELWVTMGYQFQTPNLGKSWNLGCEKCESLD